MSAFAVTLLALVTLFASALRVPVLLGPLRFALRWALIAAALGATLTANVAL